MTRELRQTTAKKQWHLDQDSGKGHLSLRHVSEAETADSGDGGRRKNEDRLQDFQLEQVLC